MLVRRCVLATAAAAVSTPFYCPCSAADASNEHSKLCRPLRFPYSWTGIWHVRRILISITGDVVQAESAWRALGGVGDCFLGREEEYSIRLLRIVEEEAAVSDKSFEICSRCSLPLSAVTWEDPTLEFRMAGGARARTCIIERSIFAPGGSIGAVESIRGTVSVAGERGAHAVNVRSSVAYRMLESGLIEATEVVKTFDGESVDLDASGLEASTSLVKSRLSLSPVLRPYSEPARRKLAYPDGYPPLT